MKKCVLRKIQLVVICEVTEREGYMSKSHKVRISLDCSAEERRLIKALATLEDMTISDYLLALAKSKMDRFSSLRSRSLASKESETQSAPVDPWDSFLQGTA